MPAPLPASIGPFAIESVLGSGGMGIVYRGRAPDGTAVALKVLREGVSVGTLGQRFAQESALRIDHPNVVRVLDGGEDDGSPYLVLELLDGESLEVRVKRGPVPWPEAVAIAVQACRGLEAVHARGIVHRDLKPANLFVTSDGTLKLLDFGVARVTSRDTRMTMQGAILGTPSYLSPEQARGDPEVDARADIWALGALLYELVSGVAPFDRPSAMATVVAVLIDTPLTLQARNPAVPKALSNLVQKCLAKACEQRWSSAAELRAALEHLAADQLRATLPDAPLTFDGRPSIAPGEQRLVALLFANRVTDLGAIASAVEERGGIVSALLGNRAIGVFGAERWEGDEAARAAAAALHCRRAAAQVAVASGRASSREGLVSGVAVERAERGCAAGLDGVAVDADTAALLTNSFSLRRKGDLFEVIAERRQTDRPEADARPQTFGRDMEVAQLRVILETVVYDRCAAAVLVTGPPGSGKTQLFREMRALLAAAGPQAGTVLTATARPLSGGSALSLVRSLLERRATALHRLHDAPRLGPEAPPEERRQAVLGLASEALGDEGEAREHAIFLGELLGVAMQESAALRAARSDGQLMADRFRLALLAWLAGLLAHGPVALVVEDIHWADESSLALLEEMLGQSADLPLLMVATARSELDERHPDLFAKHHVVRFARLALRGLSPLATRALSDAVAGRELADALVQAVHARTGGNPLFIAQIVATLRDAGQLDELPQQLPLPVTVEAAAQSRLDHLPPDEKDLCRRASVWGRPFVVAEVTALGVADAPALLASLVRREVLATGGPRGAGAHYQFRSSLVMDVAYRMLDTPFRAELHASAGECLAKASDGAASGRPSTRSGVDPEEVARHFELGGILQEAARWYATAAVEAGARADSATVIRASDHAFALGPDPEVRFELHMARAEALRFLGKRDERGAELEQARALAATPLEHARVLVEHASWLTRVGRAAEAIVAADGAARAAREASDDELFALALGRRAEALMSLGSYPEAQASLDEASAVIGDRAPRVAGQIADWRGRLAAFRGDVGAARAAYELAAKLLREAGDVRRAAASEVNVGDAYNRFGDHTTALRALERALEDVRRVGHRAAEGYALLNLGYSRLRLGELVGARLAFAEAAALADEQGDARLSLFVRIYEARTALADARAADAMAYAERAVDEAEHAGQAGLRALALAAAARASLSLGNAHRARILAREASAVRAELHGLEEDEPDLFLTLAEAERQCGDDAAASETLSVGRRWLVEASQRIADPEWRRRFLDDVPEHRALLEGVGEAARLA